jgi:hypothetical protein
LIYDPAMARHHLPGVEMDHARNGREVLGCARNQFIRGVGYGRVSPKKNDMRKHFASYEGFSSRVQPRKRLKIALSPGFISKEISKVLPTGREPERAGARRLPPSHRLPFNLY